jgi:beta-aspartyl-peptidase (threonine type)
VLESGGSSLDAVVATIKVFEDDPLFNAGKGAVFTNEGKNELDASIMDGRSGLAGAVAGVTTVKNPITAARAVMEKTRHVLLTSSGADQFATLQKLDVVSPDYFFTQHRWDQLQKAKEQQRIQLDHDGKQKTSLAPFESWMVDYKYGTVGAVALDAAGNLAAGTSTGGLTNKLYGRVGDSPIIGAGTYADNGTVAVSGTGTGEFFIRGVVAYDIAARMKYAKKSVSDAVDETIKSTLVDKEGRGGVIALDKDGNIKFGFNTEGMYRGYIRADAKPVVHIYKD